MLEAELVDGITGCTGVELEPPLTGPTGVQDDKDGIGQEFEDGMTGLAGVEDGLAELVSLSVTGQIVVLTAKVDVTILVCVWLSG